MPVRYTFASLRETFPKAGVAGELNAERSFCDNRTSHRKGFWS